MGYFRAFTIVPKSSEREIRAKLRKYCSPIRIFESENHVLLTYESRYFPRLSPQTTFTMAVDARNLGYFKRGRTSLGKQFGAIMKFTMGISVSHSMKGEIPDVGQELLRKLEALCSSWEIDEDEDRINLRFDVLLDESAEPRKHIRRLAQILERNSIPYGAAIVDSAYSIVEGELPDSGLFCGPDVYVEASQDNVELLLNESESMLEGMDVGHWKRKRGRNGYYIEFPLQPRGLDPHEKRRKYVGLISFGPDRGERYIPIAEMSEIKILDLLDRNRLSDEMRRDMENELAYRKSLRDPT